MTTVLSSGVRKAVRVSELSVALLDEESPVEPLAIGSVVESATKIVTTEDCVFVAVDCAAIVVCAVVGEFAVVVFRGSSDVLLVWVDRIVVGVLGHNERETHLQLTGLAEQSCNESVVS